MILSLVNFPASLFDRIKSVPRPAHGVLTKSLVDTFTIAHRIKRRGGNHNLVYWQNESRQTFPISVIARQPWSTRCLVCATRWRERYQVQ